MLNVENIYKAYKNVKALQGVSFSLNKGQIIGLLGPDGSGKTSLMRIIVTLIKPDQGQIFLNKKKITENKHYVRSNIGYMPEKFSLYQDLTIKENLLFFAKLFGIDKHTTDSRIQELYAFSNLEPFANRKAGALSGGMKQKLALSCMLMHKPECIILDEPSTGVDPVSRRDFWTLLHTLANAGTAILISTPYLEEAQECHEIILMNEGNFLTKGTPEDITSTFKPDIYCITTPNIATTYKSMYKEFKDNVQLFGSSIHLKDKKKLGIATIKKKLVKYSDINSITNNEAILEDVFLDLIEEQNV